MRQQSGLCVKGFVVAPQTQFRLRYFELLTARESVRDPREQIAVGRFVTRRTAFRSERIEDLSVIGRERAGRQEIVSIGVAHDQ